MSARRQLPDEARRGASGGWKVVGSRPGARSLGPRPPERGRGTAASSGRLAVCAEGLRASAEGKGMRKSVASTGRGGSVEVDALLVRIGAHRDRDAFRQLAREAAPRLRGYLRRSSRDDAQVDDLVQDVMLTLWRRADTFDPARASGWTWIFAIARNRRIDLARKSARAEVDLEDPVLVRAGPDAPDRAVGRERLRNQVREALDALPEGQRDVIVATYFEGATFREAAESQGLAVGTAKSRMRLALKALREVLMHLGEG